MASGGSKRKFNELENGNRMRQRRRRTAFTEEQLDRLEECFIEEKFPGITIREELAQELNIKEDRIQVWFQNRRSRWRRYELKNKRQRTRDGATPAIPPASVFPPFPRRPDSTVTSLSFPASFSSSAATSLALRCKTSDHQSRSVIGHDLPASLDDLVEKAQVSARRQNMKQILGELGEFSKVMQTLDCVSGLHNCLEFSQLPSYLDEAM